MLLTCRVMQEIVMDYVNFSIELSPYYCQHAFTPSVNNFHPECKELNLWSQGNKNSRGHLTNRGFHFLLEKFWEMRFLNTWNFSTIFQNKYVIIYLSYVNRGSNSFCMLQYFVVVLHRRWKAAVCMYVCNACTDAV